MKYLEGSVDVDLPIDIVYNQWTQFEEFPHFMQGVVEVQQLTDTTLLWAVSMAGKRSEWEAVITEQIPDRRIAWQRQGQIGDEDAPSSGVVDFEPLEGGGTRVSAKMTFQPEGLVERTADHLGLIDGWVQHDLNQFRDFIMHNGQTTGAWRGKIKQGIVQSDQ